MRHPGLDDLITAARVLTARPPDQRAALADRWLAEAHAADLYRKRLGRPHLHWGNGSLMSRALHDGGGALQPQFHALATMAAAIARARREI